MVSKYWSLGGQVDLVVVVVVVPVVGKVDWVEPLVVGVVVQSLALVPEEAVDLETDELEVLVHGRRLVLLVDDSPLKKKGEKEIDCSSSVQSRRINVRNVMLWVVQCTNCISSSSQLRHLQLQHSCETYTAVSTTKRDPREEDLSDLK